MKDLGPDILNLVPDPKNIDPWEEDDRLLFPKLDNKLDAYNAVGDLT